MPDIPSEDIAALPSLAHHGRPGVRSQLEALADVVGEGTLPDTYGEGEVVEGLERRIAELLGKPAAVLMPSGTMAQQIALRIWCEEAGSSHVAFHPLCHLELHEESGYRHLHGLHATLLGSPGRLMLLEDLERVVDPLAAFLIELPQREIGGYLPPWEDLVALTASARERRIALHLDGARLWECRPFYGRDYTQIAGLFDSVYVSLYKVLGGLAGAVLAGPSDFVDRARVWRRRHGGTLVHLWPLAASGAAALARRLERIDEYCARAAEIATGLKHVAGVRVRPEPPHTNMMHVFLDGDADRLVEAHALAAADLGYRLFRDLSDTGVPDIHRFELTVGDTLVDLEPTVVPAMIEQILARAREDPPE